MRCFGWVIGFIAVACSETPGAQPPDLSVVSWGTSRCGDCVRSACSSERASCSADPSCAAYLECFESCSIDSAGIDGSCERQCPVVSGTVAERAQRAFFNCVTWGSGASCTACGTSARTDGGVLPAILSQSCPNPSTTTLACDRCEDERCCDTFAAAFGAPGVRELNACVLGCGGTESCAKGCFTMYPDAVDLWIARILCVDMQCSSECGVSQSSCTRCELRHCAAQYVSCRSDPECNLLVRCLDPCGFDGACQNRCLAARPGAQSIFVDEQLCVNQWCKPECSGQ